MECTMKALVQSKGTINNRIYSKLAATLATEPYDGQQSVGNYDLLIVDAESVAGDESLARAALDSSVPVLALDAGDNQKKALARRIGFRSHGQGLAYLILKADDAEGRECFRIIEARDRDVQVTRGSRTGFADIWGRPADEPEAAASTVIQKVPFSDQQADEFVRSLLRLRPMKLAAAPGPPPGLTWKRWMYSETYSAGLEGVRDDKTGHGPPPTGSISLLSTYTFDAALSNASTPACQYVGALHSGIFQNDGGMIMDTENSFGWFLTWLEPSFYTASPELSYYQSSPANVNKQAQVTTSSSVNLGFNSSGVNGSYTWSDAVTENIEDWYIQQILATDWRYAQNTPFDGYSPSDASKSINWMTGHIQTQDYPLISKSALQFAVQTIWRTTQVIDGEVTIQGGATGEAEYLMSDTCFMGIGYSWASWWNMGNWSSMFSIDLSQVS